MEQAILDDLILAVDRALHDGHGMLNASTLLAELARLDLTVQRLQKAGERWDDADDVYVALARLYEPRRFS